MLCVCTPTADRPTTVRPSSGHRPPSIRRSSAPSGYGHACGSRIGINASTWCGESWRGFRGALGEVARFCRNPIPRKTPPDRPRFANSPGFDLLHYRLTHYLNWSWRTDSNRRPADYKSAALPTELRQRDRRRLCPKTGRFGHSTVKHDGRSMSASLRESEWLASGPAKPIRRCSGRGALGVYSEPVWP